MPLKRYLHAPTFILGNLVLDLEGFAVIFFGLSYPLHGYLHTILFVVVVGVATGHGDVYVGKAHATLVQKNPT